MSGRVTFPFLLLEVLYTSFFLHGVRFDSHVKRYLIIRLIKFTVLTEQD